MITYLKMKKNEWKVKAMVYGAIAAFAGSRKDIARLLQEMYAAFKDVPADQLRKEFIAQLAETIHKENAAENR